MTVKAFFARLARDDRGVETTEVALGIALLALIGGFGFYLYADNLYNFFDTAGDVIEGGAAKDPFAQVDATKYPSSGTTGGTTTTGG